MTKITPIIRETKTMSAPRNSNTNTENHLLSSTSSSSFSSTSSSSSSALHPFSFDDFLCEISPQGSPLENERKNNTDDAKNISFFSLCPTPLTIIPQNNTNDDDTTDKRKIKNLENILSKKKERITQLLETIKLLRKENCPTNKLKEQINSLKEDETKLSAELDELTQKRLGLIKELEKVKKEQEDLERANTALQDAYGQLFSVATGQTKLIIRLQEENRQLKQKNLELQLQALEPSTHSTSSSSTFFFPSPTRSSSSSSSSSSSNISYYKPSN